MELWQQQLQQSLTDPALLATRFGLDPAPLARVAARYPLRITPHYLALLQGPDDPLWRQCVPDLRELDAMGLVDDPLAEEAQAPVPAVVHRYPDRALLLAGNSCALYCRFCTRKRKVGCAAALLSFGALLDGIAYIERTPAIRDVLLSGGDPLLLSDGLLGEVLGRLQKIPHVEMIRIGSRVPVTLPERVTDNLCNLLRRHHPLYLNTHFNHPRELTPAAAEACRKLAAAGVPLGNQTVLLKGVNDDAQTMLELLRGLLQIRVRPYYLHQMDLVAGTGHFRTRVETGLEIMRALRGQVTGLAIPHYVIDLPGGKGKVPLLPETIKAMGETLLLRTASGGTVEYPNEVD
ncbi:KamA family radical SAM protein [Desulfuromonas carbonis]|uniref:KamA family radical SAM protein n=1 Tax=Desulfuromonas sp. DDH964 TaxID=1823759 RepID=UPI00078E900B|nr:KamA family radical SAM protein [Desulfuromonas sp. DDH964]AMV73309.1 translation elongation factor P-lysyl-lysine 2,3-aminomutase [Desulfuromonas sp. DDH964]